MTRPPIWRVVILTGIVLALLVFVIAAYETHMGDAIITLSIVIFSGWLGWELRVYHERASKPGPRSTDTPKPT